MREREGGGQGVQRTENLSLYAFHKSQAAGGKEKDRVSEQHERERKKIRGVRFAVLRGFFESWRVRIPSIGCRC